MDIRQLLADIRSAYNTCDPDSPTHDPASDLITELSALMPRIDEALQAQGAPGALSTTTRELDGWEQAVDDAQVLVASLRNIHDQAGPVAAIVLLGLIESAASVHYRLVYLASMVKEEEAQRGAA